MLGHLLTLAPEPHVDAASSFVPDDIADPQRILSGKVSTEQWLRDMGAEAPAALDPAYEAALAAHAFGLVSGASPSVSLEDDKKQVNALRTPEAVQKVVGMLSAYEWQFVEKAQEIRSYIVAGLLEETKHSKPEVRLKAFKLLGDVTEVALFTQRTEVVTRDLSDEQIQAEINKRLERLTINPDTPLLERIDSDVDDVG